MEADHPPGGVTGKIMGDIWRANLPPAQRRRTAWLPALWWVNWLLAAPPPRIHSSRASASAGSFSLGPPLPDGWLSFLFFAMAGLTLMVIGGVVPGGPVGSPNPVSDPVAGPNLDC